MSGDYFTKVENHIHKMLFKHNGVSLLQKVIHKEYKKEYFITGYNLRSDSKDVNNWRFKFLIFDEPKLGSYFFEVDINEIEIINP